MAASQIGQLIDQAQAIALPPARPCQPSPRAEQDVAATQYREQVLLALHEVNRKLAAYQACRDALARGTTCAHDHDVIAVAALEHRITRADRDAACTATTVDLLMALGGPGADATTGPTVMASTNLALSQAIP